MEGITADSLGNFVIAPVDYASSWQKDANGNRREPVSDEKGRGITTPQTGAGNYVWNKGGEPELRDCLFALGKEN